MCCGLNVYPQILCVGLGCSSGGSVLAQPVQSPQLDLYHIDTECVGFLVLSLTPLAPIILSPHQVLPNV